MASETLWNVPDPANLHLALHQSPPVHSATLHNFPKPGHAIRHNLTELSVTFLHLRLQVALCPALELPGTFRNLRLQPPPLTLHQTPPEPTGTFRSLCLPPAPAHWRLSGLKPHELTLLRKNTYQPTSLKATCTISFNDHSLQPLCYPKFQNISTSLTRSI